METLGVVSSGTTAGLQGVASVDALVATLFRDEGTRLLSLARLFVDDRTAAEDLVQEAFIRLARSAHRIRDEDRAAAYLRSIVINLARDHNRRGLVSFRHRPPAAPDAPSAEEHATETEGRQEVVEALVRSAKTDMAPSVRACCCRCLAEMQAGTPECLTALQGLEADEEQSVRTAAATARAALEQP